MHARDKIIMELMIVALTLIATVLVFKYIAGNFMYSQTEKEEEANLKRLFGDAWREAKDL